MWLSLAWWAVVDHSYEETSRCSEVETFCERLVAELLRGAGFLRILGEQFVVVFLELLLLFYVFLIIFSSFPLCLRS